MRAIKPLRQSSPAAGTDELQRCVLNGEAVIDWKGSSLNCTRGAYHAPWFAGPCYCRGRLHSHFTLIASSERNLHKICSRQRLSPPMGSAFVIAARFLLPGERVSDPKFVGSQGTAGRRLV